MYKPAIPNTYVGLTGITQILAVLVTVLELWLFYKYVLAKMSDKSNIIVSIIMIVALLFFIIITLIYFRVTPTWDFGDVLNGATDIANNRPIHYREYFEMYPHNLNPAIFIGLFMRILGKSYWAPYIINAIFILSSVIIAYLLSRKILGPKLSTLVPIICIFSSPLYLYAPIVYTDTLSMPFPVLSVLFWVMARSHKTKRLSKYYMFYGLIGFSSALGYLFKPVAAVGLVAAILETLLREKKFEIDNDDKNTSSIFTRRLIPVIVAAIVFGGTIFAFDSYKASTGYSQGIPSEKTFPLSHWFMLGINKPFIEGGSSYGYGGFSHKDMFYTKSLPTVEQKKSETKRIFKERFNAMGLSEYGKFLLNKLEYTWNDGTFYVLVKLTREPLKDEPNLITGGEGVSNKPYLIVAQLTHAVIVLLMLIIFIGSLFGKCNSVSRMLSAMCLGVMIFLLFWEARSRYIVTLIPIFNILAAGGVGLLGGLKYKKE